jgi:hypothetical protein
MTRKGNGWPMVQWPLVVNANAPPGAALIPA